jgi:uncharacterized protein (TIRG00374 family)
MGRLRDYASEITPGVVLGLIAFQLALLGLGSFGWRLLLREAGIDRGMLRTFLARISGFSIMYLTPAMSFAGIPARASSFKDSSMSERALYATIALDSFIETAGKIPAIVVGFFSLLLLARPGAPLVLLGGGFLLALLGISAVLVVKLFGGGSFTARFLKPAAALVAKISPRLACRILRAVRGFARDVSSIVRRKKVLAAALLVAAAVSIVEVAQALFILQALGCADVFSAFVVYSSVLVHGVIGVLPGNLGGMEGTHIVVFGLLGLDSARGILYSVLLRIGQMSLVLAGLLAFGVRRFARSRRAGSLSRRSAGPDSLPPSGSVSARPCSKSVAGAL